MAGKLSVNDFVALVTQRSGVPEEPVRAVIAAQAAAVCDAVLDGNVVPVPGLGLVERVDRPARTIVMQFGPRKGQPIEIPPSRKLKFHVGETAKDAVLAPCGDSRPDVFTVDPYAVYDGPAVD